MTGQCPKCKQACEWIGCPNCGNATLSVKSFLGIGSFVKCRACDKAYSHLGCYYCGCSIPARAFLPTPWVGMTIAVLVLLYWIWSLM